jgi:hypothetical protein
LFLISSSIFSCSSLWRYRGQRVWRWGSTQETVFWHAAGICALHDDDFFFFFYAKVFYTMHSE